MNHDTPEAIAITDKAARELMAFETSLQSISATDIANSWVKLERIRLAAPELLKALKEIDERLTACLYGNIYAYEAYDSYYQSVVRDAIAKATGEQA